MYFVKYVLPGGSGESWKFQSIHQAETYMHNLAAFANGQDPPCGGNYRIELHGEGGSVHAYYSQQHRGRSKGGCKLVFSEAPFHGTGTLPVF